MAVAGKRIFVLGGSGMLGSMVADYLSRDAGLSVTASVRSSATLTACKQQLPCVDWCLFDALDEQTWSPLDAVDWIVNAIGIIKPLIHDDNASEVVRAVEVNARFPYHLGLRAQAGRARVLQIATDCVFSGKQGGYAEHDPHDAFDVYGKSKSLGEVNLPGVHHLRCSIVGPELGSGRSLIAWFTHQPAGARVRGFLNHSWNGLTTLQYAKLCSGIIAHDLALPHVQHIVPAGAISKASLLGEFARAYGRTDIIIDNVEADTIIDRTLRTDNEQLNRAIWRSAGYEEPLTVGQMVAELGRFDRRLTRFA